MYKLLSSLVILVFLIDLRFSYAQEHQLSYKPSSLLIKDMTWPEVVLAINNGFQSVIIPTGGMEQNGHHMIIGKHDYIINSASESVASLLGLTLVAPVVSFVPQGNFDPKTDNMKFPGTIGITKAAFSQLLDGIARSLRNTGFKYIYFLSDHGGSIEVQENLAATLTKEWQAEHIFVHSISKYYLAGEQQKEFLESKGYTRFQIGDHAGMLDTSELLFVHPSGVNLHLLESNTFPQSLRGDSGEAQHSTSDFGKSLIEMKIQAAITQIKTIRNK